MITTMSKAQGMKINLLFTEGSRHCSEARKRVSFITAQPLIKGASNYIEEDEDIFISTASSEKGTRFYVNPYNRFKTEFEYLGKNIKLVSRTIQVWDGVTVEFKENKNHLEDHFIIKLENDLDIQLSTRCGEEETVRRIENNTHISIPLECAEYAPGKIFLCSMAISREAKSELGHDLVDREADSPKLTIRIHERPVEVRVNQSIAE